MATNSVPGADPKNNDKLNIGCWAEHEDGSMIFVKGVNENDIVVFEIYDFADEKMPVFYQQALALKDFEKTFSYDPKKIDKINMKWTWHDKTPFPWEKIMQIIQKPVPVPANVEDTISAAKRIAESLKARVAMVLTEDHILEKQGLSARKGGRTSRTIIDRLKGAMAELIG